MKIQNKYKRRFKKTSLLFVILLLSFFPSYLINFFNFTENTENLQEDLNNERNFDYIKSPQLSILGEDPWWDNSWNCRMLINVTNPYPYDFENYGVSLIFNYTHLGQNVQPSLNDIRIVENDTLRKYYVKKDYPSVDLATVWFDTNINDSRTEMDTYMYFGNEDAPNAEALDPSESFGWIKNGDFELDIDSSANFNPFGWNFSHDPADTIYGYDNPGVTDENSYGIEFINKLLNGPEGAERVFQGTYSYKFGADTDVLGHTSVYNSYAGAFFSYPFTIPKVWGAGIKLILYRNPRTWGFTRDGDLEEDGYYIRLCDNYGPDPDTHTEIGTLSESYIEIYGGRAFVAGNKNNPTNWQQPSKLISIVDSTVIDTYSTSSAEGDLTGALNFSISKFEGDTIFLEFGVWGQEANYHTGFFQIDDIKFNYTDFSTTLNELQYVNSTATIITRDVDGRIVPGVEVMLVNNSIAKGLPGYQIAQGFSDSNGRVTFANLKNRRYNITANYTLGSLEREVFNSYDSEIGPYFFNGIFYTETIYVNLWTIDFEIVDWDGIPLSQGYVEVNESGGGLLDTLTLNENGKAIFRWLNTSDYDFRVYYENDNYRKSPILLNESSIHRNEYDKIGDKFQEYTIWVNKTNLDPPGTSSYSISEYIYTNGSTSQLGNKKIIKADISLTNMIDQLTEIRIYYVDEYNSIGTGQSHLIYSENNYGTSDISDFIELDIPLIKNTALKNDDYEVYGLLIKVDGLNFSNPCNGIVKVDTVETCNIYNRTHLARINIQTIDEYSNPISSIIHISEVSNGRVVNLTASSSTTIGWAYDSNDIPFWYFKDRTYNFTVDAYNLTRVNFDVSYSDPHQEIPTTDNWHNYTLNKGSTLIFTVYLPGVNSSHFLTAFTNSSGTIEAYWGENLAFIVKFEYSDDNGQTWNPVIDPSADCTISIRKAGITLITKSMEPGAGAGIFSITINSSRLSAGGSSIFYTVSIEGSYPGYPDPIFPPLVFELKAIPTTISAHDPDTQIELSDKLYTTYYAESVSIMVQYSINETGLPLEGAYLTYEWLGLKPVRFYADLIDDEFYSFTLETSDAQTTGLKVITISALYENYTTQSNFLVYLDIKERKTTLNNKAEDLVYVNDWVYVQAPKNFIFTYRDFNTEDIVGDLTTSNYVWEELYENGTKVPGRFGSGALTQNLNQSYMLDFNTELRPFGYYFLYVTLKQDNYEQKNAFIYLEIRLRKFTVTIEKPQLGTNDQIVIDQGRDLDFEIHLLDDTRGEELQHAIVKINFKGINYTFGSIDTEPGVYNITLLTRSIDTFIAAQTFITKIYVNVANFTSQEFTIYITVKMQEIWGGMPTFYFIIITSAIVGVVGSIVGYRVIQQARIPKHVKKIRKVKGLIKSKKNITESFSVATKEEMMVKLFGEDWKEVGLSIEEALGIADLKKKSSLKDNITKERGENE